MFFPVTVMSWDIALPPSITPYQAVPIESTTVEPYPGGVYPLTIDQIRVMMIEQSIAEHPDCPCPYSLDNVGGQCGTNSKYYRPGGFRVKCFLKDISSREVYFWKLKYATPWPWLQEIKIVPLPVRAIPRF